MIEYICPYELIGYKKPSFDLDIELKIIDYDPVEDEYILQPVNKYRENLKQMTIIKNTLGSNVRCSRNNI